MKALSKETVIDEQLTVAPFRFPFMSVFMELYILLRIQYAEVRETWVWVIGVAAVLPLTTLLFMKFFLVTPSLEMKMRIISGNMIFPIIIMSITGLGNHISICKQQ